MLQDFVEVRQVMQGYATLDAVHSPRKQIPLS
jgi:hypothetical protein